MKDLNFRGLLDVNQSTNMTAILLFVPRLTCPVSQYFGAVQKKNATKT